MDELDITPKSIVRDNNIVLVMEHMLKGDTQKQACALVGIDEKTFSRGIAANPELLKQFNAMVQSRLANLSDGIMDAHSDAIDTLRKELYRLKGLLDLGDPETAVVSFEDRIKITIAIMKIDKYLVEVIEKMYPQAKEKASAPSKDSPEDDKVAEAIFASMQDGPKRWKVEVKERIVTFEEERQKHLLDNPDSDIVDTDTGPL